MHQKDA